MERLSQLHGDCCNDKVADNGLNFYADCPRLRDDVVRCSAGWMLWQQNLRGLASRPIIRCSKFYLNRGEISLLCVRM